MEYQRLKFCINTKIPPTTKPQVCTQYKYKLSIHHHHNHDEIFNVSSHFGLVSPLFHSFTFLLNSLFFSSSIPKTGMKITFTDVSTNKALMVLSASSLSTPLELLHF